MTKKEYMRGKVLEAITAVSEKYPSLRVCQILGNCYPQREPGYPRKDMYYVEDEDLLNKLVEVYELDEKYANRFDEGVY